MHTQDLNPWKHDHLFGLEKVKPAERRTMIVVVLTVATMVVEIAAGLAFGSMALLADGLHMASHALALGIALFAYRFARRYAGDPRLSWGTGKVNALGGFTGAMLLLVFAAGMLWESIWRMADPIEIAFDQAILVAVLGLVVNLASAAILIGDRQAERDAVLGGHSHGHDHRHKHQDHNLRSAYLHVVADALTSVLAIFALLVGKYLDAVWLDPAMGMVGAILIVRWSITLLRDSAKTLLDWQASEALCERLRAALEQGGDRVADLHVWSIGPGIHAAVASLVADEPAEAAIYHRRIPKDLGLMHVTVEAHRCSSSVASTLKAPK